MLIYGVGGFDSRVVCSIMISTSFKGNNMYTVEYQTEEDTVKEIHRTSLQFLYGLIVFFTVCYFIR